MEPLKCLIVDDEPIARQIVRSYVQQLNFLTVAGECGDAMETINFLNQNTVDILFLDINMPVLNGLSLLKTLAEPPKVILTTAYKDYALDAFELRVSDYLLKPFSFERFFKAIQKVQSELAENGKTTTIAAETPQNAPPPVSDDFEGVFIKVGKTIFRFAYSEILFCESQHNYTRIVTLNDDIRTYQTLTQVEEQLPASLFLRTHRSFLVGKQQIKKIDGNRIFIGNHEIPIGANYREQFLERLGIK
ncbi:MAG: hypothetical protein RL757_555 [Bacteroidota bacterium]|jgi:DNA-binding LytR/AlgR family response regulator